MEIEKQILDLEKKYWQALKDNDIATCLSLTDDSCIVAGPQGFATINREAFRKMAEQATYKLNSFNIEPNAAVMMLTDDVAIVAYKVHEDLTVDGKPVVLDAADCSTWIRRNGTWKCALHTESLTGDPFGRDRTVVH